MKEYSGCKVLVTGAGGSIGSEICRQLAKQGVSDLFLVDISEIALFTIWEELQKVGSGASLHPILGDVSNDHCLKKVNSVDFVFHAAAYKHVNLSQLTPAVYFRNNIGATHKTLLFAERVNARFVLVSSDKAVKPSNAMGKSKRACEVLLLSFAKQLGDVKAKNYSIVRFGNVLNSSGSVIPIFKRQIAEGGPVTVTDRHATRYFMSISEAVSLVLICPAITPEASPIYTLDMGPPVSIYSLACNLIEEQGFKVTTDEPLPGEIQTTFIGLRPGEKLSEELTYTENEQTEHDRVQRAAEFTAFGQSHFEACLTLANTGEFPFSSKEDWYLWGGNAE